MFALCGNVCSPCVATWAFGVVAVGFYVMVMKIIIFQEYLEREDLSDKNKQKRMKKEMRFARESSTTLPSTDPLFKIQVTLPNRRRRDKNAKGFGDSLMAFLAKKSDSYSSMDYNFSGPASGSSQIVTKTINNIIYNYNNMFCAVHQHLAGL